MQPAQPQQPPPQMSSWQQQNFGYVQPRTEWSKKAIGGFVLALTGLVFSMLIIPIVAIPLSVSAYRDARDNHRLQGKGLAVAGIVLGSIDAVIWLALFISHH
jgi:hypothetical protein